MLLLEGMFEDIHLYALGSTDRHLYPNAHTCMETIKNLAGRLFATWRKRFSDLSFPCFHHESGFKVNI